MLWPPRLDEPGPEGATLGVFVSRVRIGCRVLRVLERDDVSIVSSIFSKVGSPVRKKVKGKGVGGAPRQGSRLVNTFPPRRDYRSSVEPSRLRLEPGEKRASPPAQPGARTSTSRPLAERLRLEPRKRREEICGAVVETRAGPRSKGGIDNSRITELRMHACMQSCNHHAIATVSDPRVSE